MQIIVLALGMGIASFFVIATYIRATQPAVPPPDQPILSYVAAFYTANMVLLALFVPGLLARSMRRKLAPEPRLAPAVAEQPALTGKLLGIYQTKLIVTAAILESAAFLSLVAHMIEGQLFTQVLAALMLMAVVAQLPTQGSVENWLSEQQRLLENEG
jgi:hypothetical protein